MMDLNSLSPQALKAAVKGGTDGWGKSACETECRYIEPQDRKYCRRKCPCGCGGRISHRGMVKGIALAEGCELSMKRWERDPRTFRQERVFQIGDEVLISTKSIPRPGVIIGCDKMPGMPTFFRVQFPHGGNCLIHPREIKLVKSKGAYSAVSNVVRLGGRNS